MTDQPTTQEEELGRRPFAAFLLEQRNGALALELGEALAELTEAVRTHGTAGSLTLKITLKPVTSDGYALEVADDLAVKKPTGKRGSSLWYPTEDGDLSRTDPRQARLPLRPVAPSEAAPAAPASTGTGD